MRVATIIGHLTLNECLPEFEGASLKLGIPMNLDDVRNAAASELDFVVLWDDLGAASDTLIALSESAEAARPFRPALKPVDAYNAAILENIEVI
ncbi:MAG: EutN/CcmL family microcompartment protein [Planctomycetota bacterium]|nr:EutN/CcmL family microcompartment protein [Planctomycetota bacterium]